MGECMVDEIHALRLENRQLQATVDELRQFLSSQSSGFVVKCGYLYKHRPWALRFLEKQWELRYFSLNSNALSYWKSEAEASNHPRGRYVVDQDWIVGSEGPRDGKDALLVIQDGTGAVILRLSAGSVAERRSWLSAFRSLGCRSELDTEQQQQKVDQQQGFSNSTTTTSISESSSSSSSSDVLDDGNSVSGLRQRKASYASPPAETESSPQVPLNETSLMSMMRPSVPAHRKTRESPLSSSNIFKQSHAGLFNLCIVVLVAVNSRLIIENLMKYGLLIQTSFLFSSKSCKDWPLLMCGISLPAFPLAAYLIEKLKARSRCTPDSLVWSLHLLNLMAAFAYPIYVIHRFESDVLSGVLLMLTTLTGWMKLVSYAHTNADIRAVLAAGGKIDTPAEAPRVDYPDNISLKDMAYFILAPTLCYQMSYPRSKGMRTGWILRQLGKWIVFNGFMGFIVGQYMNPIVRNSSHPLKSNYLSAMERVLKLSIPTLYVWLGFFYCFFHLWLNIMGELLCFGDREFYKDWWNAKTVDEYWRLWNMPVHKWLVRHIYFPCLRLGLRKQVALLVVFVISGAFHEICIAVPCHMLRGWAFLGIIFQVPLVVVTGFLQRRFQSSMVGNMIFWFFFCIVGQPMSVLLYYHDVVNRQQQLQQQQQLAK